MTQENKAKLVHGLSDFHLAVLRKDDVTGVEYSEVHKLEGAVNGSITPNTESNTKYADNIALAVLNNLSDIDATLLVIDIPRVIKKDVYGQTVSESGVLF